MHADFKHKFEIYICIFCEPMCNIIEDGFLIPEIILVEKTAGKLELLEMKEDQALQIQFRKLVPESKYSHLKLLAV